MLVLVARFNQYFSHSSTRSSFHRPQCGLSVILEYPGLSSGIIVQQLVVFAIRQRPRPYNPGFIDIGIVEYPFKVNVMLRTVTDEHQDLGWLLVEASDHEVPLRDEFVRTSRFEVMHNPGYPR